MSKKEAFKFVSEVVQNKISNRKNVYLSENTGNFWWGRKEGGGIDYIKRGGLVLLAFNEALLLKQLWRVLTKPILLMSKVVRVRCFHKARLVEAKGVQGDGVCRSFGEEEEDIEHLFFSYGRLEIFECLNNAGLRRKEWLKMLGVIGYVRAKVESVAVLRCELAAVFKSILVLDNAVSRNFFGDSVEAWLSFIGSLDIGLRWKNLVKLLNSGLLSGTARDVVSADILSMAVSFSSF
ncbi:translocase inner membrane subunit 23-2 [Striga asiatica]|uniref:Translocase inner membrane subunit 23-2 n=1 Tax=Striga asiatica TaxID=4170 RepID=A0A5A7Q6K7_STRAF|nr:translocase inner membrane subunit 23-2 [Striga asiatica]